MAIEINTDTIAEAVVVRLTDFYGDRAKFIGTQPGQRELPFASASKPIKDFRESWTLACARAGVPGSSVP